jgi:hypothetical protein
LQEVFLSKLNHFSQWNTVLDAAASNIDGCLWRGPCVLHVSWIGLFRANGDYLHLGTPKLQEVLLWKRRSLRTVKPCTGCSCFEHTWFPFQTYICFFNLPA